MKKILTIVAFALISYCATAQTVDQNKIIQQKLDSLLALQRKMYNESKAISNPLANKRFGVEINPLRFLVIPIYPSFSGSFSVFCLDRKAEIAFPLLIEFPLNSSNSSSQFRLDGHYRYFLNNTQNGFYLSVFTRFQHYNQTVATLNYNNLGLVNSQVIDNRLGVGFGLGFRKFSNRGLYWGCSLSLGRYLTNAKKANSTVAIIDLTGLQDYIFDIECFKVGYAF